EAREENAKDFSLVAALLLCENGLSWHGRPRPCKVGSKLRARQEIRCTFCCWPPGPLARRERRAYPLRYVRSEQHSQRACGPQPGGARRRAGICGVAAPRRCHHIACVAAPCICPPGARAKMHALFSDGPLATETRRPRGKISPPCLCGQIDVATTRSNRSSCLGSRQIVPV